MSRIDRRLAWRVNVSRSSNDYVLQLADRGDPIAWAELDHRTNPTVPPLTFEPEREYLKRESDAYVLLRAERGDPFAWDELDYRTHPLTSSPFASL